MNGFSVICSPLAPVYCHFPVDPCTLGAGPAFLDMIFLCWSVRWCSNIGPIKLALSSPIYAEARPAVLTRCSPFVTCEPAWRLCRLPAYPVKGMLHIVKGKKGG